MQRWCVIGCQPNLVKQLSKQERHTRYGGNVYMVQKHKTGADTYNYPHVHILNEVSLSHCAFRPRVNTQSTKQFVAQGNIRKVTISTKTSLQVSSRAQTHHGHHLHHKRGDLQGLIGVIAHGTSDRQFGGSSDFLQLRSQDRLREEPSCSGRDM